MKQYLILLFIITTLTACGSGGKAPADKKPEQVFNKQEAGRLKPVKYAWPRYMGADGTGISPETGLNLDWKERKPALLWKRTLRDEGYAGPSVAKGMVFILDRKASHREVVLALNLENGKEVWRYTYDDPGPESYGFARTTPTYHQGRLYTLSRNGMLHCLDASNGKKIWAFNIIKRFQGEVPRWQLANSPVIYDNRLIVCPGGRKGVVALDPATGKTLWQGGNDDRLGYATPVLAEVDGTTQLLLFTGGHLMGVAPGNGKVLWKYPWSSRRNIHVAQPLPVGPNRIFITTGYKRGCAMIEVRNGTVRKVWENENVQAHFNSPIFYKGHIYANSDPDHLVCLNPADGRVLWKKKGFQKGGLIIVEGMIIAMSGRNGYVFLAEARPDRYKERGRIRPLGGRSWSPPVLADGRLLVRNRDGLACLDLRKE